MWKTAVVAFLCCFFFLPPLALAGWGDSWVLRGRVLPAPAQPENGHYEVGLFSSLSEDGLPDTYPIVQAILPKGRWNFELRVPARIKQGFLFAEFVESGTGKRTWIVPTANPWTARTHRLAELFLRIPSRPLAKAKDNITIEGRIGSFFSGQTFLPQTEVMVKIRGREESVRTDSGGNFRLEVPRFRGSIFLELLKPGYHPSIVPVLADEPRLRELKIASRDSIEKIARQLGLSQNPDLGVIIGAVTSETGKPLSGFGARTIRTAAGPFYFDDEGNPSRDLRNTSSDGRFIFLNVKPGPAFLEGEIGGESIAPLRITTVAGGELLFKHLVPVYGSLSGRLLNAMSGNEPEGISGARVRVEGSSDWTTSDFLGSFRLGPMRWFRGEKISLMFSAERFYNHRYQLNPQLDQPALKLYAFPAGYLDQLARNMGEESDSEKGMVIGRTLAREVRIDTLADHSDFNDTKDFYFDSRGRMRATPAKTDPRYGTYFLMNVPSGHSQLLGIDGRGFVRMGKDIFAGPNVVNVEVESPSVGN